MIHRRDAMIRLGWSVLATGSLGAQRPGRPQDVDDCRGARLPAIAQPILFNTPDADRILEGLRIFPADNPWNLDISD